MLQELTFKEIALTSKQNAPNGFARMLPSASKRTLFSKNKRPVIILEDRENNTLPIYISEEQAKSIVWAITRKDEPTRPLTHDLFTNFLTSWSMELEKVVINSVNENGVYIASLIVKQGDITKEIDCRPSDAIALAVRTNCPIFADSVLIEASSVAA